MTVTSKIRRQGGAAVITIPPALLKLLNLDVGAEVQLSIEHGRLLAEPAARPRKRYTMAEMLEGGDAMEQLNGEVAWAREGDPVGHEIA